jgi:hypothetical protein
MTDEDQIKQILFIIYGKYGASIIDALINSINKTIILRLSVSNHTQACTDIYNQLSKEHKNLKEWKFTIK